MSEQELERIKRRFSDAYRAREYAESARLAAEGAARALEQGDAATRIRMRLWEGESHWQRNDAEAAIAALTEAAQAEPQADPADTFNAITTLLTIAILERPLSEANDWLERGREHLAGGAQSAARHMLDLSQGDLAARRGDWDAALVHYRDAYEHQRTDNGTLRFTPASYMIKLAEASFMLADAEGLKHWCRALDEAKKEVEGDRLRAEQARLLCFRAGIAEPAGARTDPCNIARRVLRWLDEIEGYRADYARDALHVLLLHGDWLSVETWLEYPGIGEVPFIRGDLCVQRARAALGSPARDLIWPSTDAAGTSGGDSHRTAKALEHLAAARSCYEGERSWVAREDRRLETDYYSRMLEERLHQLEALTG